MRIAWFFKEHRIVAGVVIFDLLILLVLGVMMIMKAGKTATVDILTVPSIAKVKIGGAEYSSGAYRVRPGDYEAEVKAEGFVTKTVPVNARNGEISKVWVYLVPEEGNLNYYAQHEEDWDNMRMMGDEEARKVYKILSIQEELPMDYIEQVENGEEDLDITKYIIVKKNQNGCEGYYCLRVATVYDRNEGTVRDILGEKGFNLDDYNVDWVVYDEGGKDSTALTEMQKEVTGE